MQEKITHQTDSDERYRSLFYENRSVMLIIDPESGAIIDANHAAVRFYGWTRHQLMGMRIQDINRLSEDEVQQEMARAKSEKRTYFRFQHRLADGGVRDVDVYSGPVTIDHKPYLYSIIHDVTELKRSERLLMESESRYRALLEGITDSVFVLDRRWRHVIVNSAAELYTGLSRDQLLGNSIQTLFPGIEQTPFFTAFAKVMNERQVEVVESEFTFPDGSGGWYEVTVYPVPEGILCISRDVTARKKSEERLKEIIENMPVMLDAFDDENRIIAWNKECERVTGYSDEEILNHPDPMSLLYPDEQYLKEMTDELIESEYDFQNKEWRLRAKDGSDRWVTWSNNSRRFPIEGWTFWATGIDTTARRKAEEELREKTQMLNLALQSAVMGVWKWYVDSGRVEWAGEHAALFGIPIEEFGGTIDDVQACVHPQDRETKMAVFRHSLETGAPFDSIYRVVWPDGRIRWMHSHGRLFYDEKGEPDHILGTTQDITRRKTAQLELQEALREKDQLLKELQHRAKNSFSTISSLMRLKSRSVRTDEAKAAIDDIRSRVLAMAELYAILHETGKPDRILLDKYCQRVTRSVMSVIQGVTLSTDIDPIESNTKNAAVLGLIITEIITNAVKHAFGDRQKGNITLALKQAQDRVILTIADDGAGLPKDFDISRSAGLGLQLVQSMTDQLNGQLEVVRNQGTLFRVDIPIAEIL